MTVISISGELGSAGSEIAERAARKLGYYFAGKSVIGTILFRYGFVDFDQNYDTVVSFWSHLISKEESQRALMVDMLNRVILALAHHGGVVIAARGSFAILGGFADVLNVRVEAPLAVRAKRLMKQKKISPDQAEAIVKESDQARKSFISRYYGTQWDKSEGFDLAINTGKVSPELATTWLVGAANELKVKLGRNKRTTDSIQVDSILAFTVAGELQCRLVHSN